MNSDHIHSADCRCDACAGSFLIRHSGAIGVGLAIAGFLAPFVLTWAFGR